MAEKKKPKAERMHDHVRDDCLNDNKLPDWACEAQADRVVERWQQRERAKQEKLKDDSSS